MSSRKAKVPARAKKVKALRISEKQLRSSHRVKKRVPQRRSGGSWRPGQSGNPAGRPRSGHALSEVLAAFLEDPYGRKGISRKWALINKLFQMAMGREGSVSAARLLVERSLDLDLEARVKELEEQLAGILKIVKGAAA